MPQDATRSIRVTDQKLFDDAETAAMYLEEMLVDGDEELFKQAIKDVVSARVGSMTDLARKTKLIPEDLDQLYQELSCEGSPRLDTLQKVLHAAGLRLSIGPDTTA